MKYFKNKIEPVFLIAILLVAFSIRFVNLINVPVGFNADEASFGYDSYSILHTGKDQWGNFIPLVLKSFGDYKSPLYSYLALPSISALGLNVLSVRLPNVIVGTLSVLVIYLLVNKLFKYKNSGLNQNIPYGLVAALFLALNPWSIMLSRGAFEANLVTLFIPLGLYFFLKGFENHRYLSLSSVMFGLSLFSYHSAKVVVPLLFLLLMFLYISEIKKIGLKSLLPPFFVITVFFMLLTNTLKIGGNSRIIERSITKGALEEGARQKITLIQNGANPIIARILHNKYQVVLSKFLHNYKQYFSSKFLFYSGAGEAYYGMTPGIGVLNIFEGIALLGVFVLMFTKKINRGLILTLGWLLVAPLAAALATGVGYSGNRAVGMVPAVQILAVYGISGWAIILSKYKKSVVGLCLIIFSLLIVLNILSFINKYFYNIPKISYQQMLYGNLEMAILATSAEKYKNVIISRSLSEPQIFLAFVAKWDPNDYQAASTKWDIEAADVLWVDQLEEYKLGKYVIKSIDWVDDLSIDNTLILARPTDVKQGYVPDVVISYPNGEPSVYATNN